MSYRYLAYTDEGAEFRGSEVAIRAFCKHNGINKYEEQTLDEHGYVLSSYRIQL